MQAHVPKPFPVRLERIPMEGLGILPPLIEDYLNDRLKVSGLVNYPPTLEGLEKAVSARKNFPADRAGLVSSLRRQNAELQLSKKTEAHIESLLSENAFTITTAHQPMLFTGKLYLIHKIASAIRMADMLGVQLPQYNFVPVFWLGSEDHDFRELNHIHIFNKKISWESGQGGAVGRMNTGSIGPALKELQQLLDGDKGYDEIMHLFETAYSRFESFSGATRFILNELFGSYGLVILDGDDIDLKKQFGPVIRQELTGELPPPSEELEKYYHSQAHAREINLFLLTQEGRERIIHNEDETFSVLNSNLKYSSDELLRLVDEHPEHFSPNVILRPLFQELVLPGIAFCGGAAELSYWMQLKPLFEACRLHFPVLILRDHLIWIDQATGERMKKYGLRATDIFGDPHELINAYVARESDKNLSLADYVNRISSLFDEILSRGKEVDPTLEKAILAEKQKTVQSVEKLQEKMVRAEKRNFEIATGQINGILEKLLPGKKLHERHDNLLPFYAKYGAGYIGTLIEQMNPLDWGLKVVGEGSYEL